MALKIMTEVQTPISPQIIAVAEPQALTEIEILTSEYLKFHKKYEEYEVKELVKQMDDIRKQLVSYANEHVDNDKPVEFSCVDGSIHFSERGENLEITNVQGLLKALIQKFGEEATFSIVGIALTPLRKMLTEKELLKFGEKKPGSRTLKTVVHL